MVERSPRTETCSSACLAHRFSITAFIITDVVLKCSYVRTHMCISALAEL